MIAAVLRRSSLASGRTLSASLSTFDSGINHHLTPAATGVSTKLRNLTGNGSESSCNIRYQSTLASSRNSFGITGRDFLIRSEPSMVFPAGIAVQGYATASESIKNPKHTSQNVKALSRKEIAKLSSIQKEAEGGERGSKIKGTKICIAIRSFDNPEKQSWSFPPHTRKVAMPDTRTLYTVLRSPHVDKKSREQFEMRCKKRFLIIKAQSHELNKKLFWLKRQRILGAQYEVQFHCKTRLNMASCFQNINSSAK